MTKTISIVIPRSTKNMELETLSKKFPLMNLRQWATPPKYWLSIMGQVIKLLILPVATVQKLSFSQFVDMEMPIRRALQMRLEILLRLETQI